jgi:hypothetical protein
MIIDISTTSYPNLSYRDEYRVKGNKLLTELNRINIKMSVKHNYIIIPMTVYNILEYNILEYTSLILHSLLVAHKLYAKKKR